MRHEETSGNKESGNGAEEYSEVGDDLEMSNGISSLSV